MSLPDLNCPHDWKVEYSSEKNAFYLFDAENKIIAIFPQEKRDYLFFKEYVKYSVLHMSSVFWGFGKYRKLYDRMSGLPRKKKMWARMDKDLK